MTAPIAKKIPVTREFHGDVVVDNYEWLREKENPELLELLRAENEWTASQTAHLKPMIAAIVGEIASRTREDDVSVPVRHGEWWYRTQTWEGKDYSATFRTPAVGDARPDSSAAWDLVWDGNALAEGEEFFSDSEFVPAPDGELAALGVDFSGDEHFALRIFRQSDGVIVDESVQGIGYGLVWLPDSSGILYARVDEAWRQFQVWLHTIGTFPSEDRLLFEERDEKFSTWIRGSRDGRWGVITSASSTTAEVALVDLSNPVNDPIIVSPRRAGLDYSVEPAGSELLIIHNLHSLDFEVSRAPIGASAPEEWESLLVPEPGERIGAIEAFRDFAVISMRSGGRTQLRVMKRSEGVWQSTETVATPASVTVEFAANHEWDAQDFVYTLESLLTPCTHIEHAINGEETTLKILDVPNYDRSAYVEEDIWVEAEDGAQIPVTLVRRADVTSDGTNPGRIYGYGSYEVSMDTWFSPQYISYLDRGAVLAIAHIRGGGEMGRSWYDDGKMLNKRNTFTDFVTCARWLQSSGWVQPGRLVAEGRSAGGLLMGAVANLAPDAFRAIHAGVPFVDSLTTILNPDLPLTAGEWEEWGNPIESAEVYHYMKSYSPTENIAEVEYPAILATTSLNDIRVFYVEPTKWVQLLREHALNGPDRPILEKIEMVAGHRGPSGRYAKWESEAFIIAWLLSQVGVFE